MGGEAELAVNVDESLHEKPVSRVESGIVVAPKHAEGGEASRG